MIPLGDKSSNLVSSHHDPGSLACPQHTLGDAAKGTYLPLFWSSKWPWDKFVFFWIFSETLRYFFNKLVAGFLHNLNCHYFAARKSALIKILQCHILSYRRSDPRDSYSIWYFVVDCYFISISALVVRQTVNGFSSSWEFTIETHRMNFPNKFHPNLRCMFAKHHQNFHLRFNGTPVFEILRTENGLFATTLPTTFF